MNHYPLGLALTLSLAAAVVGCGEGAEPLEISGANQVRGDQQLVPGADGFLRDIGVSCDLNSATTAGSSVVTMTLRNEGNQVLRISPRGTAWDNGSSVFEVMGSSGRPAPYRGIWAFRDPPTASEQLLSTPGKSLTAEYDTSANYVISEQSTIRLLRRTLDVWIGGRKLALQHDCEQALVPPQPRPVVAKLLQPLTYEACSSDRVNAFETAKATANSALHGIDQTIYSHSAVYQTWFNDDINQGHVADAFAAILANWDEQTIECVAQGSGFCETSTNAYVDGWNFGTVYVCDKFWTLRAFAIEGESARAGVFVHELSHLYAFTTDYTNDPEEAKELAVESPDLAAWNAENYERFSLHQYLVRLAPVLF